MAGARALDPDYVDSVLSATIFQQQLCDPEQVT